MGRTPLSDEEKIRRGTLDPRTSEEERDRASLEKVLAFPTFHEIPDPTIPLNEIGRKTYDKWARDLFNAGRLTQITQLSIENLALADQTIAACAKSGKAVPGSIITQRNRAAGELKVINVDPSLTPKRPDENKFSRNGFPARRQSASRSG